MKNIPQVPQNRAKVCKNHDARKAVSASLSVLRLSGARFRPRSSKVSVQKDFLFPFHCKPGPSGVSLESPRLENIPQVTTNQAKVAGIRGIFSSPEDSMLTHDELSFQLYVHRQKERTLAVELLGRNIAPLHFKTERVAGTALRAW